MKTMINIKTDVKIKKEAQKIAKQMGLPLSTIINAQLRRLIEERRAVFDAPYVVKPHIARELEKESAYMDAHPEEFKAYTSVEDLMADLNDLRKRKGKRK